MSIRNVKRAALWGTSLCAILALTPDASACGGFFCSQAQPVNQAAERIVFADNGDGTVTAVIQIMYEGPSESFSWLLPISSVPEGDDIEVASDIAFQRLQASTNPNYSLTTSVEGQCRTDVPISGVGGATSAPTAVGAAGAGGMAAVDDNGVTVAASGVVGSFEWTVLALDPELDDPADAAVNWLTDNGYDVTDDAPGLIGPYLEDGMYLLALRLVKGSDVGSIRPIVLTYDAEQPMIPIKLTAVAANNDMGVMTWVASDARAVPQNYLSLELNEARINWFNASLNYGDVVNEAADEAGGQGFVTESAGPSSALANAVWTTFDESNWESFSTRLFNSFSELFLQSYYSYGSWDGYWEAVQASVTLPDGVAFEDFKLCPNCYSDDIDLSPSEFMAELESGVIQPVRRVQELLDAHEYVTRLYTTMSAGDMTLDPSFTFNADLEDVSNIHTAQRIIECDPSVYQFEAPWRIELPQGGVVRGVGQNLTWPTELDDQPANIAVVQLSGSGQGMVVTDNEAAVSDALSAFNDSMGTSTATGGTGGTSSTGSMTSAGEPASGGEASEPDSTSAGDTGSAGDSGSDSSSGDSGSSGDSSSTASSTGGSSSTGTSSEASDNSSSGADSDSGCALSAAGGSRTGAWVILSALALGLVGRRRRRNG